MVTAVGSKVPFVRLKTNDPVVVEFIKVDSVVVKEPALGVTVVGGSEATSMVAMVGVGLFVFNDSTNSLHMGFPKDKHDA